MNSKKIAAVWLSLAMMFSFIVIIVEIAPIVEAPTTWYVDDVPGEGGPDDPPENFTSIREAINAANTGDTIFVYKGRYSSTLIDKTVNLIGEDKETTIIDRGGAGDVVIITSDWVNISGFTITGGMNDQNWG